MLTEFILIFPVLLVSLVLHELAHGYVAYKLGDRTAKSRGRLSLNPLHHLDPFGSLVLFITFFGTGGSMLFGWAKPVPINPGFFKSPQRGMALVGAAGPFTNFMIAVVAALILNNVPMSVFLQNVIMLVLQLNVILMLFNLIPVPPLDGSRIVGAFMGKQTYMRWIQMDQYGMIFMMVILFLIVGPLNSVFHDSIRGVYEIFLPSYR